MKRFIVCAVRAVLELCNICAAVLNDDKSCPSCWGDPKRR